MVDSWKTRARLPKRPKDEQAPGWYSRGYLPHFDGGEITQTVTFRLFDSLSSSMLEQWEVELLRWPEKEVDAERRKRIEAYLDKGFGSAWLKEPRIADKVQEAMLFFDGRRYRLHAWVVMPNHAHALLTPCVGWELGQILHSWKSFTANECNRLLGREGEFWQKETFDRRIRDDRHYHNAVAYIENNPVKAGLCRKPEDRTWNSASWRKGGE